MSIRTTCVLSVPALAALFASGGFVQARAADPNWKGQETIENGVVQVQNPATAALAPTTLRPEKLWAIGGDTDAEGEFFGVISDIAIAPSGEIYLLDMQLHEIKVFSAAGEYLRTIGREGEGPGEFRRASALFLLENGNICVMQGFPARAVVLTPDGEPATPLTLKSPEDGGFRGVFGGTYRGGSLVLQGTSFKLADGKVERLSALVRIDTQGQEVARFFETKNTDSMSNLVIRERQSAQVPWGVTPDGRVVASTEYTYGLQVWGADGKLQRVIKRDYAPRKRSAAELEERRNLLSSSIRMRGRGGEMKPNVEVEANDRDIVWLEIADDGHMWVLTSRGAKEPGKGNFGAFDVLDAEGHFVQQVTLALDADFEEDRILLTGDRLFVLKQFVSAQRAMLARGGDSEEEDEEDLEGEAEPMSVVCYRFGWTPGEAVAGQGKRAAGGSR